MARRAKTTNAVEPSRASIGVAARTNSLVEWVLGLMLIGVVVINVINASGRYLFSTAITGADELMVYVIIFVVMGGAVLALARRRHININLLPSYMRGRWRHALFAVHDLVAVAVTAYAAHASWTFVQRIARVDTKSMALGIPMVIPHSAVLAGFVGMAIVAAVCLLRDVRAFASNTPESLAEAGQ